MGKINNFLNNFLEYLKKINVYPTGFQFFFLSIFCLCILFLLLDGQTSFSTVNPGMILIWNLWWPLIPLILVFTGRLWCSFCPFASVSIMVSRIFPHHLFNPEPLVKNGALIAIIFFSFLQIGDNTFVIAVSKQYTLFVFLTLFALLIISAIFYDYKTYCKTICPFGLFSHTYHRFFLLKILNGDKHCDNCYQSEKGKSHYARRLLYQPVQVNPLQRDWKSKIECLKKCSNASVKIAYMNPLKQGTFAGKLELIDILIPSTILTLFVMHVFIKSNFFVHLYSSFHFPFSIGLNNFIILMVAFALSINVMIQMGFIYISKYLLLISKENIYRGMVCITPLLIAFHISIVLHDLNGISIVRHIFPSLNFL